MSDIQISTIAGQPVGILPGQAVSSFAVKLPPLSAGKLAKALPHIMADYLADERGETVFCLADKADDGTSVVLACEASLLRQALAAANEKKANLSALWPDYMQLTIPESGIAVLRDGTDVLARRADGTGFRLPQALAEAALSKESVNDAVTAAFPNENAGFATGRFGPNLPLGKFLKAARRTLILAGLAGFAWASNLGLQGWQNDRQGQALQEQAVTLYKEQFPEARRIVNVEAQLRGKLGASGTAQGFSGMMTLMQGVMAAQDAARLEELSYVAQPTPSLKLVVATPGFSKLESLRAALTAAGFRLNGGSSKQINGVIRNEMTLTMGGRSK